MRFFNLKGGSQKHFEKSEDVSQEKEAGGEGEGIGSRGQATRRHTWGCWETWEMDHNTFRNFSGEAKDTTRQHTVTGKPGKWIKTLLGFVAGQPGIRQYN